MSDSAPVEGDLPFEIFRGETHSDSEPAVIPAAPPWRTFGGGRGKRLGTTFVASEDVKSVVNAALHLRRPILITGDPGTGKSSVAYAVQKELGLGEVIKWPINSRSTLGDGQYQYDAISRLQDTQRLKQGDFDPTQDANPRNIGDYITLGPLGTAMITSKVGRPSVLLIDEIDKSDIDLPNDLLNVFEDGYFDIPELLRLPDGSRKEVPVFLKTEIDGSRRRTIPDGTVICDEFPFIVITSNGERELPAAFNRRCLRLDIKLPEDNADAVDSEFRRFLMQVVQSHLDEFESELQDVEGFVKLFRDLRSKEGRVLAIDQLLQAVYIMRRGVAPEGEAFSALRGQLEDLLFRDLKGN
ncbi:MAG: MoxR family ATPase [Planctomycetota bacterium]